MSSLVLVRHGQARAFEKESDRLSEHGEKQAALLGAWWRERGVVFDEVFSGALVRQVRTAELAGLGPVQQDPRWNEYDAGGVLEHGVPALAAEDPAFAQLAEAMEQHRTTPDANRHFQRMFEVLMNRWVEGTLPVDGVETWTAFQSRVRQALTRIVEGPSRDVVVVTSGGPIATAVQTVLQAPSRKAIEINWRVRNCSLTEFLFSKGRISLDGFNAVPHLPPASVTYR